MINPDEDMIANVVDPLILEIYLYKNNYKDRILISELKEKAHTVRIPEMEGTCFFVRVEDVISILNTSFKKDIKNFGSISEKSLSNNVTSIYFIDNMIKSFESIKYFKVNVSNSEVYTKLFILELISLLFVHRNSSKNVRKFFRKLEFTKGIFSIKLLISK
jgi:hypothetical protein